MTFVPIGALRVKHLITLLYCLIQMTSRVIDQTAPVARESNFVKSLYNKILIIQTYLVLNAHLFESSLGYIGFREYNIFMNFFF